MSLSFLKMFYFSLFAILFAPSVTFTCIHPLLNTLRRYWFLVILTGILSSIIIYTNTIVHPYMLADNRHYLFYVWNKFYGRFWWFRYAMVPFYLISTIILYHSISMRSAGFQLIFILCTFVSISLQQLIEIRYFILSFLIVRLSTTSVKFKFLILELILHLVYLFATKEIYWKDYNYIQRLIW